MAYDWTEVADVMIDGEKMINSKKIAEFDQNCSLALSITKRAVWSRSWIWGEDPGRLPLFSSRRPEFIVHAAL